MKIFYFVLRQVYKCPYWIRYIFHWLLYYYNKLKAPEKMRGKTKEIIKQNASVGAKVSIMHVTAIAGQECPNCKEYGLFHYVEYSICEECLMKFNKEMLPIK